MSEDILTQQDYLAQKREELLELSMEVELVESLGENILVSDSVIYPYSTRFFSEDYSLATDFEIAKFSGQCNLNGASDPEGGLSYQVYEFFPFFSYHSGSLEIGILNPEFEKDKCQMVLRRFLETNSWGHYSETHPKYELKPYQDDNLENTLGYFGERGVRSFVLDGLKKEVLQIGQVKGF